MSRFLRDISPEYLQMEITNSAPVPSRKPSRWDNNWEDEPTPVKPKRSTEPKPRATQMPKPRSSTPPPSPAPANGNFAIHSADELHEGSQILHQRFGRGTVTHIDTSGSDAKIDVIFADGQTRKLLLKFAKFEIL